MIFIQQTDFLILDFIQQNIRTENLDMLMSWITGLGDKGFLFIAITLLLFLLPSYRKLSLCLGIGLIIDLVVCNLLMKPLFQRLRPCHIHSLTNPPLSCPPDFSFPSGHAMASFVCAAIIYHFNKKWGVVAYIIAVFMTFSRLYLYVHFPSDVISGAVIGVLIGVLVIKYIKPRLKNI